MPAIHGTAIVTGCHIRGSSALTSVYCIHCTDSGCTCSRTHCLFTPPATSQNYSMVSLILTHRISMLCLMCKDLNLESVATLLFRIILKISVQSHYRSYHYSPICFFSLLPPPTSLPSLHFCFSSSSPLFLGIQLLRARRHTGEVLPITILCHRVCHWVSWQPYSCTWLRVLLAGVAELQHLPHQPGSLRPYFPLHAATALLPLCQWPIRNHGRCLCDQPLYLTCQSLLFHPLHGFAEHGPLPARETSNTKPLPAETTHCTDRERAGLASC